jgi:hypothetical protein
LSSRGRSRRLARSRARAFEPRDGAFVLALLACACTRTLDAGHNRRGLLPVDQRNPAILYQDDWSGDWLGEYAVLFAAHGGPPLAGIVVNASSIWTDLNINASGWKDLVTAARSSGLESVPDVTPSAGAPLVRPADGQIDSTTANGSAGAHLIVDASSRLSMPGRPVVVVCGTSLTDVADAYLLDHGVVDRVVVVAALGSYVAPNGIMGGPNGDMDPWADWIVAQKLRYIQISAYYDQSADVPADKLPSLPSNPLGDRIRAKQPNIIPITTAADQVALLAVALPAFAVAVEAVSPDVAAGFDATQGPRLLPDAGGRDLVVTTVAGQLAAPGFWDMLLDSQTFGP